MDKREYQEKLQEINRLIAVEDYEGAARIADSIDWKRVRNVQTLVTISEVYEILERYEDSKTLLLRAYRRSPVGRTVLYRLVECCIKLRQFDQAIEYYSEYVQAAPHDNNKYILKYKIYRGRGSSLDEQIDILKEYLDQEYNEKWAYELARLEIQAGRVQEGLATCDDLVLWFHSGKYVIKALELKKKYAPLTPKQQEIYDNRFNEEDDEPEIRPESYLSEAASLAKAERAAAAQEEIKSELAADISNTAKVEATKAELTRKAQKAQAEVDRTAAESFKAMVEPAAKEPEAEETKAPEAERKVEAPAEEAARKEEVPAEEAARTPLFAEEPAAEEPAAKEPAAEEAKAPEAAAEEPGAARSGESMAEAAAAISLFAGAAAAVSQSTAAEETAAQEPAAQEESEPVSPEQMQEDMVRSMREIVSGVGPKDQIGEEEAILDEAIEQSKEDQEEAVAARGTDMTFHVPASEASQKRQAGKLTIDDILLSMGDRGDHVRQVTGGSVMSATEESQITAQQQAEAKAASYNGLNPADDDDPQIPHFLREPDPGRGGEDTGSEDRIRTNPIGGRQPFIQNEVYEARQTKEIPAEEIAATDDALRLQMGLASRDQAAGQDLDVRPEEGTSTESETDRSADRPGVDEVAAAAGMAGMIIGAKAADGSLGEDDAQEPSAPDADEAAAAAALLSAPRVEYTKEIAEAKTRRLPVDEIRKLHEAYLSDNQEAAQEAAKNAPQAAEIAAEMAEAEAAGSLAQNAQEDEKTGKASGGEEKPSAGRGFFGRRKAKQEKTPAGAQKSEAGKEGKPEPEESSAAGTAFAAGMAGAAGVGAAVGGMTPADEEAGADFGEQNAGAGMPESAAGRGMQGGAVGEQVTREVPKSEPDPQIFTGRQQLRGSQMELFRGFTSIGNLSEQIAGAIWQAENRRDDRTSLTGNILILGAHGCGKTTIATGIAKAIAEDMGSHSVKMARIYAADLNRKDIAATIAKIAGGVLIVEEAGDLDDGVVDQLTTAMEFRTDGLIMILEDEQRYIHDLLMRHPRFTMKFTAQIYIPEYSVDDLVNFGQIYANSKDYVFSEKAVDACLARIENARKGGETVSVTNVIELVERAIKNANTFFRRLGSAKKRYDSEDRIILREKDFR